LTKMKHLETNAEIRYSQLDTLKKDYDLLVGLDNGKLKEVMARIWVKRVDGMINNYQSELSRNTAGRDRRIQLRSHIKELQSIKSKLNGCLSNRCQIHKSATQGMQFFEISRMTGHQCVNLRIEGGSHCF